jgi:bifunctional non-homologous end joining protein LigD
MMATLSDLPADEQNFAFEYKWDGVRAIAYVEGGRVRIDSRNQLDITRRYPELQQLADALGAATTAVLDGEIVALDDVDRPSFARLQRRMHLNDPAAITRAVRDVPIFFLIFDLLALERPLDDAPAAGEPTRDARRADAGGPVLAAQPGRRGRGSRALSIGQAARARRHRRQAVEQHLRAGQAIAELAEDQARAPQEFVIGGWVSETGTTHRIGSLLVGYFEPTPLAASGTAPLRYAGRVGSGLMSEDAQSQLMPLLKKHAPPGEPVR